MATRAPGMTSRRRPGRVAQLAQGVVEPRADRPVGDAQDRGDLGQGKADVVVEHHDRAMLGREPVEGARQRIAGSRATPMRPARSARPAAARGRGRAAGGGGPRRARPARRADRSRRRSGRGPVSRGRSRQMSTSARWTASSAASRSRRYPVRHPEQGTAELSDQELVRLLVPVARPFHQTSVHGTSIVRVTPSVTAHDIWRVDRRFFHGPRTRSCALIARSTMSGDGSTSNRRAVIRVR